MHNLSFSYVSANSSAIYLNQMVEESEKKLKKIRKESSSFDCTKVHMIKHDE